VIFRSETIKKATDEQQKENTAEYIELKTKSSMKSNQMQFLPVPSSYLNHLKHTLFTKIINNATSSGHSYALFFSCA